jgi:uncharacterized protein YciI
MFTSRSAAKRPIRAICALWRAWYNATVATFLVIVRRVGPRWDRSRPLEEQSDWDAHAAFMDGLVDDGFIVLGGPLADEERVAHVIEADSEQAVRATLARDPWSETHLVVDSIEPWTLRLDSRRSA